LILRGLRRRLDLAGRLGGGNIGSRGRLGVGIGQGRVELGKPLDGGGAGSALSVLAGDGGSNARRGVQHGAREAFELVRGMVIDEPVAAGSHQVADLALESSERLERPIGRRWFETGGGLGRATLEFPRDRTIADRALKLERNPRS
jgi:hypothetical protein